MKKRESELIKDYDLTKLKEDPDNPNVMKEQDFASLGLSLDDLGHLGIILIDQDDMIINGTHTWKQMIAQGETVGDVKRVKVTEKERRLARQTLNYGPHGKPEKEKQKEEILALHKTDSLELLSKMTNEPIDQYLELIKDEAKLYKEPETIPEGKSHEIVTPAGGIWKLGNHRLMCGDALNNEHVLALLESDIPRVIFTDPPYDLKEYDYLQNFFETIKDIEVLVLMDDHGTAELISKYKKWFIGFYPVTFNSPDRSPNQPMISHRLVNHYRKGRSNFKNLKDAFGTVQEITLRKDGMTRWDKPLDLPRRFIIHYSTPGEIILDLFGGSCSTLFAAEQTGRICLAMEKDRTTCDAVVKKWETITKSKAELI